MLLPFCSPNPMGVQGPFPWFVCGLVLVCLPGIGRWRDGSAKFCHRSFTGLKGRSVLTSEVPQAIFLQQSMEGNVPLLGLTHDRRKCFDLFKAGLGPPRFGFVCFPPFLGFVGPALLIGL